MRVATLSLLLFLAISAFAQTPSFRGRHDYEVEGTFLGLSVYDCNADGVPDLVDWGSNIGEVQVLFGSGDGTFQPVQVTSRSIVSEPFSQAVADFNNDGRPDIVQFGYGPNNNFSEIGAQVILGAANCSFPAGGTFKILSQDIQKLDLYGEIVVGDFNSDGNMDVIGLLTSFVNNVNYFAWVFLPGDGKGNFGAPVITPASLQFPLGFGIGVGDFNQDGHLDMAVPSSTGISIWYGLGNGKFRLGSPEVAISGLYYNLPMEVVDVNKDGYLDLVTSTSLDGGEAVIVWGGPKGKFSAPTYVPGILGQVRVGDMNGDQLLDLVGTIGNGINEQGIGVALGKGNKSFSTPSQLAGIGGTITVADLRNKGVLDIIQQGDNAISVLLNNGNNTYPNTSGIAVPSGADPNCVALADFNGDGIMDAAFIDTLGTVSVLFGTGKPAVPFRLGPTTTNTGGLCLKAGDFNNDGIPDLVISSGNPFGGVYQVLKGNGDGTFTPEPVLDTLGFSTLCTGDFNGDGNLDVVNGYGIVALGKGDGSFNPPVNLSVFPNEATTYCATGDLNSDGITDIVLSSTGHQSLYVYLGNKAGTFAKVARYPSFLNFPITVADVNADGIPDVVGVNDQGIQVFLGAGGGVLVPQALIPDAPQVGDAEIQVVVADFNGDGKVDLAIADQDPFYGGYISLMTGNGDGTFVDAGLAGGWLPVDAIAPIYLQGQKPGAPYDLIEAGGSHFAWLYNDSK